MSFGCETRNVRNAVESVIGKASEAVMSMVVKPSFFLNFQALPEHRGWKNKNERSWHDVPFIGGQANAPLIDGAKHVKSPQPFESRPVNKAVIARARNRPRVHVLFLSFQHGGRCNNMLD